MNEKITAGPEIRAYTYMSAGQLTKEHRKESIAMEENENKDTQEGPRPLTDEEFEQFQKKQKRESGIIKDIIDFILGFFH